MIFQDWGMIHGIGPYLTDEYGGLVIDIVLIANQLLIVKLQMQHTIQNMTYGLLMKIMMVNGQLTMNIILFYLILIMPTITQIYHEVKEMVFLIWRTRCQLCRSCCSRWY